MKKRLSQVRSFKRRLVLTIIRRSLITKRKRNKLINYNNPHYITHPTRSLNDFPDSILWHILCFLPTQQAVRTSVLSKRWRYVWASLPNLDFQERDIDDSRERDNFIHFVDRVLHLHKAPCIKKFSLSCWVEDDVSRISNWISTALSRNLQECEVVLHSLQVGDHNVLPHSLFICQTLQVLNIHAFVEFVLPPQISLPNLKKLTLTGLTFKEYRELNLLFASTALEELIIDGFVWEGEAQGQVTISAPNLRSLRIDESSEEILNAEGPCSVTISSPKLTTFRHSGGFVKNYQFPCSSSILKATLIHHYDHEADPDNFHTILRSFQLVTHLELSYQTFEGLSDATVPILKNLINLKVSGNEVDLSCKGLEIFLKKCPRLETLKLPWGISEGKFNINRLLCRSFTCLSSLKKIMIGIVRGNMKELTAVHVLVGKAKSLETMNVCFSFRISLAKRMEIMNFLYAIPGRSCKICLKNYISCHEI